MNLGMDSSDPFDVTQEAQEIDELDAGQATEGATAFVELRGRSKSLTNQVE
jgi:hypothetical protein